MKRISRISVGATAIIFAAMCIACSGGTSTNVTPVTPQSQPKVKSVDHVADVRTRWVNVSYFSTISHVEGTEWKETDDKTGQDKWKLTETSRTPEYIELFNSERNQQWRVLANKIEFVKNGKWEWLSNGHWDSSALPVASVAPSPPVTASDDDNAGAPATVLPDDLGYTIEEEEFVLDEKRAIEVRLRHKVSEDVLRKLGTKLYQQRQGEFKRTFIAYLLPRMEDDRGWWATTHFTPKLEVKIYGFSLEEETRAKAEAAKTRGRIIGKWINETLGELYVLYSTDKKTFYRTIFRDCTSLEFELTPQVGNKRFEKTASTNGDYLFMHGDGTLRIGDIEGEYLTLFPVDH